MSGAAAARSAIFSISPDNNVVGDGSTDSDALTLIGPAAAIITSNIFDDFTATDTAALGDASSAAPPPVVMADPLALAALIIDRDAFEPTNQVELTGTADANSLATLYDGQTALGTTTANASRVWSFVTDPSANGVQSFTAAATDAAGDASAPSAVLVVTVDPLAPAAPIIDSDALEGTNQVVLTGTAEAHNLVTLYDGQTALGTTAANATGAWSFVTDPLANGAQTFYATATDAAGVTSALSAGLDPIIGQPTITSLLGYSAVTNGGMTADDVLTLDGAALPNSIVTVLDGTNVLGTATVNSSGNWQFTTGQLGEGVQSFTVTDTASGSVSPASSAFNATVETLSGGAPASIGVNMEGAEFSWGIECRGGWADRP